jgi:hypothetical protein
MSFPLLPSHPLTLPPTFLTVPARISSNATNRDLPHSSFTSGLQLKIKFTPHLLLPTPLISPAVTGRKVEDFLDVCVPIGGRVVVEVGVEVEGLERLAREEAVGSVTEAEEEARRLVGEWFRAVRFTTSPSHIELVCNRRKKWDELMLQNTAVLSLSSIDGLSSTQIPSVGTPETKKATATSYILTPRVSNPTHAASLSNSLSTAHPIAYLTKLGISLTWVQATCKSLRRKGEAGDNGSQCIVDEDEEILLENEDEDGVNIAPAMAEDDEIMMDLEPSQETRSGRCFSGNR